MLEIVQHEQYRPLADDISQADQWRFITLLANTERRGNGRGNPVSVGDRSELNKDNLIRVHVRQSTRNLNCQPGLANSARAGQRHKTDSILAEQIADRIDIRVSTDEVRERCR
ncbi:MAG TPA: hypothetical protein VFV93_03500 [Thermomicrobiales bacterium]|nr:hypothetical protein [Thermomicrobiales bacterium]